MSTAPKQYIVLINKSPRGPFTESEVKRLIDESIVRRTDVAFEVDLNNPKASSPWRLLWQFPAFDRRAEMKSSQPPAERRVEAPQATEEAVRKTLPQEFLDISPEELIPRASRQTPVRDIDPVESALPAVEEISQETSHRFGHLFWGGALVFLILLSLLTNHLSQFKGTPNVVPEVTALSIPKLSLQKIPSGKGRLTAMEGPRDSRTPRPSSELPSRSTSESDSIPIPEPNDRRNDDRRSDDRRSGDSNDDRDRDREDREEGDEGVEPKRKPRKSKKRQIAEEEQNPEVEERVNPDDSEEAESRDRTE